MKLKVEMNLTKKWIKQYTYFTKLSGFITQQRKFNKRKDSKYMSLILIAVIKK